MEATVEETAVVTVAARAVAARVVEATVGWTVEGTAAVATVATMVTRWRLTERRVARKEQVAPVHAPLRCGDFERHLNGPFFGRKKYCTLFAACSL